MNGEEVGHLMEPPRVLSKPMDNGNGSGGLNGCELCMIEADVWYFGVEVHSVDDVGLMLELSQKLFPAHLRMN